MLSELPAVKPKAYRCRLKGFKLTAFEPAEGVSPESDGRVLDRTRGRPGSGRIVESWVVQGYDEGSAAARFRNVAGITSSVHAVDAVLIPEPSAEAAPEKPKKARGRPRKNPFQG